MASSELNGQGGGGWSPGLLLQALRNLFDDLEAFVAIRGGSVVLRLEYELLILSVPGFSYESLEQYLHGLGATVYRCRKGLGAIVPSTGGTRVAIHARVIHREGLKAYVAFEPRGLVNDPWRMPSVC